LPPPGMAGVSTFGRFAALVIARADLSRAASRVAIDKATGANVKEFAEHELLEAQTVISVLEDLGTPVPPMDMASAATLTQIINTPAGTAFDMAYLSAEHENHAFLQDLAAAYLRNSNPNTWDSRERYGRPLAKMALFSFIEHAGITQRILRELAA
jgi:hypothetical protein